MVDGSDIGINSPLRGIELIEHNTTIGGASLKSGEILVTLASNDPAVGSNSQPTEDSDIFALSVTLSDLSGGTTVATARILFDGDDVNLIGVDKDVHAIALTSSDDTTAPVQANNAGSTVLEGGTDTVTTTELLYTDSEQPATSVTYTVTTVPSNGQLELTTAPTVPITSFTQNDIDNNRLVYVHDGSNTTSDSFDFEVDDGQGNVLSGQSFALTVTPINDAPVGTDNTVTENEDTDHVFTRARLWF